MELINFKNNILHILRWLVFKSTVFEVVDISIVNLDIGLVESTRYHKSVTVFMHQSVVLDEAKHRESIIIATVSDFHHLINYKNILPYLNCVYYVQLPRHIDLESDGRTEQWHDRISQLPPVISLQWGRHSFTIITSQIIIITFIRRYIRGYSR